MRASSRMAGPRHRGKPSGQGRAATKAMRLKRSALSHFGFPASPPASGDDVPLARLSDNQQVSCPCSERLGLFCHRAARCASLAPRRCEGGEGEDRSDNDLSD
jgi:hypothetical protein